MEASFDLELAVQALSDLGLDGRTVRAELEELPPGANPGQEVAALVLESEAGTLFDPRQPLADNVVELVDAFRRAGVPCRLDSAEGAPVLVVEQGGRARAHRINLEPDLTHEGLVEAVARLLPAGYTIRLCPQCLQDGAYPIVVLSAGELAHLEGAIGAEAVKAVLPPPPPARVHAHVAAITPDALDVVDWQARYAARARPSPGVPAWERIWERLEGLDPRVAWPVDAERPPGDDFYALSAALCGEPLAACLKHADRGTWANLLYRWALLTQVGARWDRLACRYSPGSSAQGLLGLGQLSWAYFIFEALGAETEARATGALLEDPWIVDQERSALSLRQSAWFDLGVFMRTGERGPQLQRLRELVGLSEPAAWDDADLLSAALKLHSEARGDQYTHHPLYYAWPAPLYALARRAGRLDSLPPENPFLRHPVDVDDVVTGDGMVAGLRALSAALDTAEAGRLPPILDPLPVIVDVEITKIEAGLVHGRTMLGGSQGEHSVRAPLPDTADGQMAVGQQWSMRVEEAVRATATRADGEQAQLRYRIAVPTGVWLGPIG